MSKKKIEKKKSIFRHLTTDASQDFSVILTNILYENNTPQEEHQLFDKYIYITTEGAEDVNMGTVALRGDTLSDATMKDFLILSTSLKMKGLVFNRKTQKLMKK